MNERVPGRRRSFTTSHSGRWHRAVGAFGGLVFVFMALTGVAIHHADDLGLGSKLVRAPWLLSIWGIDTSIVGIETSLGWVAADGESIYPPAGESLRARELVAAVGIGGVLAAASVDHVWLLTESGDLLDRWGGDVLSGPIRRMGISADRLVVETETVTYVSDAELMELTPVATAADIRWAEATSPVPISVGDELRDRGFGPGLSLERMLLDLHSGRVAGSIGPYLMDLAALALSLVVFTGLIGWWRRWGNGKKAKEPRRNLSPPEDSRNSDHKSA